MMPIPEDRRSSDNPAGPLVLVAAVVLCTAGWCAVAIAALAYLIGGPR